MSHEKARQVIKQEITLGSQNLPWKDVAAFSAILLDTILLDEQNTSLQFFDRGIPDIVAYLRISGALYDTHKYTEAIQRMQYHTKVFFAPFWKEIYVQDEERKESAAEASSISDEIKQSYIYYGFDLVEIPKTFVEKRTDFVLSELTLPLYQQSW